jgi:hypothetical protein
MAKSNSRGLTGRRSGTVTVIEEQVRRSYLRNAKITFWVLWAVCGLLAAVVLDGRIPPVLAPLAGLLIGLVPALLAAGLIIAWPVLRALWWWAPEIGATAGLFTGWVQLAQHTTLIERLAAVALSTGIPAAIGPVRRRVIAAAWCLITRHRIRTCFSEFIITNRTGSLPLILWARPTAVGERLWIWLRPGLDLNAVQQQLDKIAVACWASTVAAEAASDSNSAYVRMDIKRRDALTGIITSPLVGLVTPGAPAPERDTIALPSALDLPDVDAAEVTPAKAAPFTRAEKKPAPVVPPVSDEGSEIEDWI